MNKDIEELKEFVKVNSYCEGKGYITTLNNLIAENKQQPEMLDKFRGDKRYTEIRDKLVTACYQNKELKDKLKQVGKLLLSGLSDSNKKGCFELIDMMQDATKITASVNSEEK
jgi:hypothetical protein